jgi:integrase/recombinase XerD
MTIKEAITLFGYHQRSSQRSRTIQSYRPLLQKIESRFAGRSFDSIGSEDIYHLLENLTKDHSKSTRRLRYAQMKAFYNFMIEKSDLNMRNPCNAPFLAKAFKTPKQVPRRILDRETVEEVIYNTKNLRDRLMVELQARCGLRIGESLKIKVSDVSDRKLILRTPKSGKESEMAFMPEQIAKRVHDYIQQKTLSPDDRLFPICYSTARAVIKKIGKRLNVVLTPHDLRRYSATHASRNGMPLEIVSKVILRHQDLKTTQAYLGRVSEGEAIRWMDILHGR